jgi:hypothetical protein
MLAGNGALIAAWEHGARTAPARRAPELLAALGLLADGETVATLPVGLCDARLLRLVRSLFGDDLELVAPCPSCGEQLEASLALPELQPDAETPRPERIRVHEGGFAVELRPPRNEDLWTLEAGDEEVTAAVLARRCVIDFAHGESGAPADLDALGEEVADALLRAAADSDPGAQLLLTVACECGALWVEELDVRACLWEQLSQRVGSMLEEVDVLARAYGWSEEAILALGEARRSWYLEVVAS